MKIPGIIGGLGPETTTVFYKRLITAADSRGQNGEKYRMGILSWSVPINYMYEQDAIAHGEGEERLLPMLFDSITRLQDGGADFLVMPCNSLHVFFKDLKNFAKIPFVSIVEETTRTILRKKFSRVAILGSPITLGKKIYQESLQAADINVDVPSEVDTHLLAEIIHRIVTNKVKDEDAHALEQLILKNLDSGADSVILACTDLQILVPDFLKATCIDTLQVLVEATVREVYQQK